MRVYFHKSNLWKNYLQNSKDHKYRTLVNVAVPSGMWKDAHEEICDEGDIQHVRNLWKEFNKNLKTITQQMLSKQLKELEADGIVNREVIQIMHPKVEYSLTEFCLSVMPILRSFSEWNKRNTLTISSKLNKNFEENLIK